MLGTPVYGAGAHLTMLFLVVDPVGGVPGKSHTQTVRWLCFGTRARGGFSILLAQEAEPDRAAVAGGGTGSQLHIMPNGVPYRLTAKEFCPGPARGSSHPPRIFGCPQRGVQRFFRGIAWGGERPPLGSTERNRSSGAVVRGTRSRTACAATFGAAARHEGPAGVQAGGKGSSRTA